MRHRWSAPACRQRAAGAERHPAVKSAYRFDLRLEPPGGYTLAEVTTPCLKYIPRSGRPQNWSEIQALRRLKNQDARIVAIEHRTLLMLGVDHRFGCAWDAGAKDIESVAPAR